MFANISLSFITNNVKGMQSYKKRLKLIQYFEGKMQLTGVLFLQKLTVAVKLNKNGKRTLKVMFSFPTENQIPVVF